MSKTVKQILSKRIKPYNATCIKSLPYQETNGEWKFDPVHSKGYVISKADQKTHPGHVIFHVNGKDHIVHPSVLVKENI